jgi:signal transduction histidine kinase
MTEVISNLLDNAIAYSEKNIFVKLEKEDTKTILSVQDTGIGIAKENLDKLFSRFTRLENAQKVRPDGTGLGLYVCRQIVEAHGGKIWAESEGEGKGSTFKILFA